jgi:ATP-dependent DNA ligase
MTAGPRFVPPMLATTAPEPFSDPAWRYEVKWDGWRAAITFDGTEAAVWSRRGRPLLSVFPALRRIGDLLREPVVLDGELLQDYGGRLGVPRPAAPYPLVFIAFDCLYDRDGWHLDEPLVTRLQRLRRVVRDEGMLRTSPGWDGEGEALYRAACTVGHEGVMAKRRDSRYWPGRRVSVWQKFLNRVREPFWVTAASPAPGGYALVLAEQGRLDRPIGRVAAKTWHPDWPPVASVTARPFPVLVEFRCRAPDGRLRHPRLLS